MYITTARLIVRDFEIEDAKAIYELIYNSIDYDPSDETFVKRGGTIDDIIKKIKFWQGVKSKEDFFEKGTQYAICLKESGKIVGAITVNAMDYLHELQIGWYIHTQYMGNGYAGEAGAVVSDYLLDTLELDYIAAGINIDNRASLRTAQKSGFKLFEKRVVYDYYWSKCNVENWDEVDKYFEPERCFGSSYYYFRKFNKNSKTIYRFYGDNPQGKYYEENE